MSGSSKKRGRKQKKTDNDMDYGEAVVLLLHVTKDFMKEKHPKHDITKAWMM